MNVKRYDINYTKLAAQRTPEEIRLPFLLALFNVLVRPLVTTYNSLKTFRDQMLYRLTITPQVVYLEKMLNDRFDTSLRRIYILDGKQYDPLYVFLPAELKWVWLYKKSETPPKPARFLYTKGETGLTTFDFVVYVQVSIPFDINEMTSLINDYKLASKDFKIQTYV